MASITETIFNKSETPGNETKRKEDVVPMKPSEPILCNHCRRTATNGIRCLGMCVADNDY
ncbi:MAG: hypothetical protein CMN98_02235 [Synechococcus sp. NP17]|jgi:hypothetical protein|nr:hypothetical protein [Synechococcus sp. NP17]